MDARRREQYRPLPHRATGFMESRVTDHAELSTSLNINALFSIEQIHILITWRSEVTGQEGDRMPGAATHCARVAHLVFGCLLLDRFDNFLPCEIGPAS
jgi:hypothetical protein